jgi:hypothetical protein
MRYEKQIGEVTFYYELNGKQDNKLFVVKFSYGSVKDKNTDFQIHQEIATASTFDEMQEALTKLRQYCESLDFKKVKSTKRNVIT